MDKQLKEVKESKFSIEDKIGMVLSRNCDYANSNGAMLSVNAFEKATEEILFLLDVSQQRELLKAFLQYVNCSDTDSKVSFDLLDKYLNSL